MQPTGMTAVLGGDQADVLAAIASHGLTPANVNGAGQIVAAGTLARSRGLRGRPAGRRAAAPAAGGRARSTPGTWPRPWRRCAARPPASRSRTRRSRCCPTPTAPRSPPGKEWLERIVAQVAAPVRWDLCMRTMADLGVTALIELPPAGTLTGLARRALPGVAQLAIKTPDQLDAARELIAEHLPSPMPQPRPHCRSGG